MWERYTSIAYNTSFRNSVQGGGQGAGGDCFGFIPSCSLCYRSFMYLFFVSLSVKGVSGRSAQCYRSDFVQKNRCAVQNKKALCRFVDMGFLCVWG